jgi:hypothetical protein
VHGPDRLERVLYMGVGQLLAAYAAIADRTTFAGAMMLRHPDLFHHLVAFSPGGAADSFDRLGVSIRLSRIARRTFVAAGQLEAEGFGFNADTLSKHLRRAGIVVVIATPVAGHDETAWLSLFPTAMGTISAATRTPNAARTPSIKRRGPT